MKKRNFTDTQFSTLSSRSDFDWIASFVAIRNATEQLSISLRESEKFGTRNCIKQRISEGKIRTGASRIKQKVSYRCNLWDVIKMNLTQSQKNLVDSVHLV